MRDKIYQNPYKQIKPFSFSPIVAKVFDDMLNRSIPFYKEVLSLSAGFAKEANYKNPVIYDLGCSTGNFLNVLKKSMGESPFAYTGIDSSEPMIHKAQKKKRKLSPSQKYDFYVSDILDFKYRAANMFIINYVLQFIEKDQRKIFLSNLYQTLKPKGFLILSEKITNTEPFFSNAYSKEYYNFKIKNNYSDIEIKQKDRALKDFLQPLTVEENILLLEESGFTKISVFFKWCNFVSILAVK
ncbi:MAG: carboxy-S-adenosyl-L-methionine synthase CmoA [Spirochaetia bacterium]|nr:carboxy-S-adenosyl-L-methionine synthase CmoA [Spirochaetia bacterium]